MEDLLDDLIIGTRIESIFQSFYQSSISVKSLEFSTLLSLISEYFKVDVENIGYYFESETNIIDESDVIDPE